MVEYFKETINFLPDVPLMQLFVLSIGAEVEKAISGTIKRVIFLVRAINLFSQRGFNVTCTDNCQLVNNFLLSGFYISVLDLVRKGMIFYIKYIHFINNVTYHAQ